MQKQLSKLLQMPRAKKMSTFFCAFFVLSTSIIANANPQPKAVWYRYYDKNGVANISTSVSPAHIKYGYEALDSNMQVIKKNQPYNAEQDLKRAQSRAYEAQRLEQDTRLKRAYGSSNVAINKKNETLSSINKQIDLQNQTLKQIQNERIALKRQEMEYYRRGEAVPQVLKDRIKYNTESINRTKAYIEDLHANYHKTQVYYDDVIHRLKKLD